MMELRMIEVAAINVEDRGRKDLGDMMSLIESIKLYGLITPIAVVPAKEAGRYRLLAGCRRLTACKNIGLKLIAAKVFPANLPEISEKAIELAENIDRKDLEWAEEIAMKDSLHTLQVNLHGGYERTGSSPEGWSKGDTAEILGESHRLVQSDLQLAKALERFPELAECQTKSEAVRIFNKMVSNITNLETAARIEEERGKLGGDQVKENLIGRYLVADFFQVAPSFYGQFDIVEIDPPYGVDLGMLRAGKGTVEPVTSDYNEIPDKDYQDFIDKLTVECFKLLKADGWCIMWFPHKRIHQCFNALKVAGFAVRDVPGIWSKGIGSCMNPSYILAADYEGFFYARKGAAKVMKQGRNSTFNFRTVSASRRIHPVERPVELMEEILSTFTCPGSRVAVPMCGSGNTLLAAHNLKMLPVGWELSKEYQAAFTIRVHDAPARPFRSLD